VYLKSVAIPGTEAKSAISAMYAVNVAGDFEMDHVVRNYVADDLLVVDQKGAKPAAEAFVRGMWKVVDFFTINMPSSCIRR
jgi:hypothetical protein